MKSRTGRIVGWSAGIILLLASALISAEGQTPRAQLTKKKIPVLTRWLTRTWVNGSGAAAQYHTSSEASDLDYDVRLGAKILKYRDGTYARAIHKQYPQVCGPASLAIVLKQLGISDPTRRNTFMPQDVDGAGARNVDGAHHVAGIPPPSPGNRQQRMEQRQRRQLHERRRSPRHEVSTYPPASCGKDQGGVRQDPAQLLRRRACPYVDVERAAVGCAHGRDFTTGLPGIMNYFFFRRE
jgi:hypothetical protein